MKFFYENKDQSVFIVKGKKLEFGAHLHANLELVYMLEGITKVFVDSREYIFSSGDVLLVFPNQIHQYQRIGNENYILAIFPPDLCSEYQNIFKNRLPASPIIQQAAANKHVLPLLQDIWEQKQLETTYSRTIMKGYFLILLGELFQMTTFTDAKATDADTLKTIINFCLENYSNDIPLDTVANALHVNKHYISHLFSEKLHMRFNEYIATLRISEACRLLSDDDEDITEIAGQVGFNSPRSFNRLFIKHVGMTPREYRRQQ